MGCVAKTGGDLVKLAFVPTAARPPHPVHEPQAPHQVASFPIGQHRSCVFGGTYATRLVTVTTEEMMRIAGSNGRPYDGVSLGTSLRS